MAQTATTARQERATGTAAPIRIVRVIARLNLGGPAIHTILLTARLDPARFQQYLVAGVPASYEGDMLAYAAAQGVQPIVIPHLGRELAARHDAIALVGLVRLFRRLRPDIVETHTAKAGTLGRLAAWLTGVPVTIHTFHGHVFHSYFGAAKTAVFLGIERLFARRTSRIIALGPQQRAELLGYGVGRPEQVLSIPVGLELAPYLACAAHRGRLRAALGVGTEVRLVGIVGRLTAIKAHEVFLAAARLVRERIPESRFVIVGDGERRHELEQLAAEHGLGAVVHFLGWQQDLPAIYTDLDVVALTSRNEGMPFSLVEAMASGRPVVATRVGGVRTLVQHSVNGLLAEPGDVATLAASIAAVLRDRALARRLGATAQATVYPAYDLSTLLARMASLYTGLAQAARQQRRNR